MKRILSFFMCLCLIFSLAFSVPVSAVEVEDYRSWSQLDERWKDLSLGKSTVGRVGCLVTALTKMLVQANIKNIAWTPGVMRDWLVKNKQISTDGSLKEYAAVAEISPDLTFYNMKNLSGNWTKDDKTIMELVRANYQVIIQVAGGDASSSHFVLVDNAMSRTAGDVIIMDSSYKGANNIGRNASDHFGKAKKYVIFKSTASGGEMTVPTVSLDRNYFYVGDTVNIKWAKTKNAAAFYGYILEIYNVTTGKQHFYGEAGEIGDVNKNYYNFLVPESGEYRITVSAVPFNDVENMQKVATGTFYANTNELTKPEIYTVKNTYPQKARIYFSWAKSAADTDFNRYRVSVKDPSGKVIYDGASGALGDVNKNSYNFTAETTGDYKIEVWAIPSYNSAVRQKWATKTLTVKKEEAVRTPFINLPKTEYLLTETVSFTWASSPENSDLQNYRLVITDPSGKTVYDSPTGVNGDVSKNFCNFRPASEGIYNVTVTALPYKDKEKKQKTASARFFVSKEPHTHSLVKRPYVAATYKKSGLTQGEYCSVCLKETVPQKTIARLPLSSVSGIKATSYTKSIRFSWDAVKGAEKYTVSYNTGKKWRTKTVKTNSFTVKGLKNNKNCKIRVTAVAGSNKGPRSATFTSSTKLSTSKLTKALSSKKKTLSLAWAKVSGAARYELQYSLSKKFTKKTTKTVKSTKLTLKKLKSKKKYYVRVRAYKVVSGQKVYGAWSSVKSVKVK